MTLCISGFWVIIDKFTEWLKRAADGIMKIVLTHKDP